MTATNGRAPLEVSVLASSDFVHARDLRSPPRDRNLFGGLSESQRQQLVHDSWSIGTTSASQCPCASPGIEAQDIGAALSDDD